VWLRKKLRYPRRRSAPRTVGYAARIQGSKGASASTDVSRRANIHGDLAMLGQPVRRTSALCGLLAIRNLNRPPSHMGGRDLKGIMTRPPGRVLRREA